MITKTLGYKSSDGTIHGSLVECQKAELSVIFRGANPNTPDSEFDIDRITQTIIDQKDQIIDILTTGPRSKPKARKINGASRAKKPKRHEAEQFPLPMEDNPKDAA